MRTTFQTQGSRAGQNGNCFSACIASLLDLPLADVPGFYGAITNGSEVPAEHLAGMDNWFLARKLHYVEVAFPMSFTDMMNLTRLHYPRLAYILTGSTSQGVTHSVIVRDGAVIHDPASDLAAGKRHIIKGPLADATYRMGIIAVHIP